MASLLKRPTDAGRRLGRHHLVALGAAALVGAGAASAASGGSAAPVEPDHAAAAGVGATGVAAEVPQPVTVDAEMIRSVARQVLLEQGRSPELTNVDLVARDVLAQGPIAPGAVQQVTRETLLGHGPGGALDAPVPPPAECPPTARACIDVDGKRAWMLTDGDVTYGPVPITTGRGGYETTRGTHQVIRHVRDEHSIPFDSPMPFSTYFTASGIAFHEGRLDEPSHGCIHMSHESAVHFFDQLTVGDEVVAF